MKVIIAGTRTFDDVDFLFEVVTAFHELMPITQVFSGGAKGADHLGELWANYNNIPVVSFTAHWKTFGKSAGPIRNEAMAEKADSLIAFWDGSSKGTLDMMNKMTAKNKRGVVVNYITHTYKYTI